MAPLGRQRGKTLAGSSARCSRVENHGQAKQTQLAETAGALPTRSPVGTPGRRGLGGQLAQTEARRLADSGWIEWGGELIWAVGFTSGGAPYGLRVCDFDHADLEAMGLDIAALHDAGPPATTPSSIDEPTDRLRNDDVSF